MTRDPDTDADTFQQFAAKIGQLEREIPTAPPFEWRSARSLPLRRTASGLAAVASVGLLVVVIGAGLALRGIDQPAPASTGGGLPVLAAGSAVPSLAVAPTTSPSTSPATSGPSASPAKSATPKTTAPIAGQSNPFDAAVQSLVADGTIDQAQADAIRQMLDADRIDVQALIDSGTLTAAQGQAVEDRLSAVKESMGPGPEGTAAPGTSPGAQKSDGAGGSPAASAALAAFDAAVQGLVTDGTIDAAQAVVLRQQIDAGSIDPQALVDDGTFTAAQMQVVSARLAAVKQSFTPPASTSSKGPSPTN